MTLCRYVRYITATVIFMTVSIAQCYGADPRITEVYIICNEDETLTISATANAQGDGDLDYLGIAVVKYANYDDCIMGQNETSYDIIKECGYFPPVEGPVTCIETVECPEDPPTVPGSEEWQWRLTRQRTLRH